jgi:hypothetical protein
MDERHAPFTNCADDSGYNLVGDKAVMSCVACHMAVVFEARYEYKAHEVWMDHKTAWFKANPDHAPSVRTIGTIRL